MDSPELTQAVATFLMAALTLATLAITTVAIPWLRTKTRADRMEYVANASQRVVNGIEQALGPGSGDRKKELARERVQQWAKHVGVTLDDAQANLLIEAAVKSMNDISVSLDVNAPAQTTKTTPKRTRDPKTGRYSRKATT